MSINRVSGAALVIIVVLGAAAVASFSAISSSSRQSDLSAIQPAPGAAGSQESLIVNYAGSDYARHDQDFMQEGSSESSIGRPVHPNWPAAPAHPHPNTDVLAHPYQFPGPGR